MQQYHHLLEAAKHNPETADYGALRMALAGSWLYNPYDLEDDFSGILWQFIEGGNFAAAARYLEVMLERNYLDIELHLSAAYVSDRLDDEMKASFHRRFAKGLLDSILMSGDGKSYETAFIVITTDEEYHVLRAFGLRNDRQSLDEYNGHRYDVHTFFEDDVTREFRLYFNVDLPMGWLGRNMLGRPN